MAVREVNVLEKSCLRGPLNERCRRAELDVSVFLSMLLEATVRSPPCPLHRVEDRGSANVSSQIGAL